MSDFETISGSSAISYRPWRKSLDNDYDIAVYASGTPATDNAAVATAVAAINSAGRGTLRLESGVELTGSHQFTTSDCCVRALGSRATIKTTSTNGMFYFAPSSAPPSAPSASHHDITATQGYEYFTTTAWTPAIGDLVMLYSTDQIPNLYPHNGVGDGQYPGELHRVVYWDSGNNRAYIDGPIVDTLSTGAKAVALPAPLKNVVVADLEFEFSGSSQANYAVYLYLNCTENAVVENLSAPDSGALAILLKFCMDTTMRGIVIHNSDDDDNVYGVNVGICNGVTLSDFSLGGCRHGFTTQSGFSSGDDRYGTPLNVRLTNGTFRGFAEQDETTRQAFKTHSEGYGIVVENCDFVGGVSTAPGPSYLATVVSRKTEFVNCRFKGKQSASVYGIYVCGPDTTIRGCTFDDLYVPVTTVETGGVSDSTWTTNGYSDRCVMMNNVVRNSFGPGFWGQVGNDHRIIGNYFDDVGTYDASSPDFEKAIVAFELGDGHRAYHNEMTKGPSNDYSFDIRSLAATDIDVAGNVCRGYGSGVVGFDGTNEAAAESAFAGDNYTD